MKCINLTKSTPIFIYGGGEQGNIVTRKLMTQGFYVFAGLDKYKSGTNIINNICTYRLGTEPDFIEKKEGVVIICVANGLLHKSIAEELYQKGYRYIVFLPLEYDISSSDKVKLTRLYNDITNPVSKIEETSLLCEYRTYKTYNFEFTKAILEEDEDYITTFINLEILNSVSYELCEGDKTKIASKLKYRDINIVLHPYIDLYAYYDLENKSLYRYFDTLSLQRDEDEKKREIVKREKLYRIFKSELQKGMQFFISSAPVVQRNPNGYFNLAQGHHRTLFLLKEEHTIFPVKMKKNDFKEWCNIEIYQELRKWILENGIEKTYAPIPHPGMQDFPAEHERFGKTRLQKILNEVKGMQDKTVLEYGDTEGYFSRILMNIF